MHSLRCPHMSQAVVLRGAVLPASLSSAQSVSLPSGVSLWRWTARSAAVHARAASLLLRSLCWLSATCNRLPRVRNACFLSRALPVHTLLRLATAPCDKGVLHPLLYLRRSSSRGGQLDAATTATTLSGLKLKCLVELALTNEIIQRARKIYGRSTEKVYSSAFPREEICLYVERAAPKSP